MTTRVLPPSEWGRLAGRDIALLLPYMHPEDTDVVVVEKDGAIVACLGAFRMTHLEGVWIDPEHVNAGVARSLLNTTLALAKGRTQSSVWVASGSDQMDGIAARLPDAERCLPMALERFVIPIKTGKGQ